MECACACSFGNLTLLSRNPTSSPPTFLTKLRFLILNRSSSFDRHNNNLLIRKACGSDENRSSNGFSIAPNKIFNEEAIGAEYGEGFETFRPDGPLKVDVDFLNDRLQESFLQRIRYAMKPDEAYGLIFSLDSVVADTRALKLNTWKQLALEEGREIPGDETVQRFLLYASVDHVLHKLTEDGNKDNYKYHTKDNMVLLWEKAKVELDRLKLRLSQLYHGNLLKLSEPMDGLKEWLTAVYTVRIPCAVVSSLDRRKMVEVLERMGLNKYFQGKMAWSRWPIDFFLQREVGSKTIHVLCLRMTQEALLQLTTAQ